MQGKDGRGRDLVGFAYGNSTAKDRNYIHHFGEQLGSFFYRSLPSFLGGPRLTQEAEAAELQKYSAQAMIRERQQAMLSGK